MICKSTSLYNFHRFELLKTCLLCNLVFSFICIMLKMSYIGDVADIAHLVTEVLKKLYEYVISDTWSCMAEVGGAVNCRAADIKSYGSFVDRLEYLFLSRKGVGYI